MSRPKNELRLPALEVQQGPRRRLYVFAVDGKVVPKFAAVSRIRRNGHDVAGYQRPEVLAHIDEIRSYIESENPMIPNAVVLAFDKRVRFESAFGPTGTYTRPGEMIIPMENGWSEEDKPGFIVDGQQRLAAVREAEVETFPLCVTAFITDDLKQQTEQFILVNSTKPLPKGLIYELLPNTVARLPSALNKRRFPAELLTLLNREKDSPMAGLIQTPTNPQGVIKDNSILRMLEASLSEGVLYHHKSKDGADVESMFSVLSAYWGAVKVVFEDAWGKPPKKSRLMHGAGILSMGHVMDWIGDRHRGKRLPTVEVFARELEPLRDVCRWTDGVWDFGPGQQRKWNELQNTSKDIQLLANHLLVTYKPKVGSAA
jgi:DGQHR domain-containing protein